MSPGTQLEAKQPRGRKATGKSDSSVTPDSYLHHRRIDGGKNKPARKDRGRPLRNNYGFA